LARTSILAFIVVLRFARECTLGSRRHRRGEQKSA
jgi:hypothetical protein